MLSLHCYILNVKQRIDAWEKFKTLISQLIKEWVASSYKPQMKLTNTIYVVLLRIFPLTDFLIIPLIVKWEVVKSLCEVK